MKYIVYKNSLIETLMAFNANASVFYPVKANINKKVIKLLDPYVCGYEVESLQHAKVLIKQLKISPNRILYTSQTISLDDLSKILFLNISNFVVDEKAKCNYLINLANEFGKKLNIILRLDVSEVIDSNLILKWGARMEDIYIMRDYILKHGHNYLGVSYYLPQEICTLDNALKVVEFIVKKFESTDIRLIDVGGGLSHKDLSVIAKKIKEISPHNKINIYIEPGRRLLNPNIDLIVTVTDIREKNNQKLVFIDSGIYRGLIDYIIKGRKFEVVSVTKKTNNMSSCIICGNSSDISDVIGSHMLPCDISIGDELLIKNCGAYCSEMDMDFCKNKRAGYVIV